MEKIIKEFKSLLNLIRNFTEVRNLRITIENATEYYTTGSRNVYNNRQQWDYLQKIIQKVFNEAIQQAKEYNLYDRIYSIDSNNLSIADKRYSDLNFIQLYLGNRIIGTAEKIYDDNGNLKSIKNIAEKGGGLSITQGISGEIAIIIFPSKSEYLTYKKDFLVYKIYSTPCEVKEEEIWKAIKFMLLFSAYTSYNQQTTTFTLVDKMTIKYHEIIRASLLQKNITELGFDFLKGVAHALGKLLI